MKKVVVVIHGSAEERRNLVAALAGPAVQVVDFGDAAQALDYLIAHDPVNLIVSDLHLSQINGWQ